MKHHLKTMDLRLAAIAKGIPGYPLETSALANSSYHLERYTQEQTNAVLKPMGLNYTMFRVLAIASADSLGSVTPAELAGTSGERATNVTHLCDELVAAGWMTRERDPQDRRRVDLKVTAAGRQLLAQVRPLVWAIWERRYLGLDAAERRTLQDLLRRQFENLVED